MKRTPFKSVNDVDWQDVANASGICLIVREKAYAVPHRRLPEGLRSVFHKYPAFAQMVMDRIADVILDTSVYCGLSGDVYVPSSFKKIPAKVLAILKVSECRFQNGALAKLNKATA